MAESLEFPFSIAFDIRTSNGYLNQQIQPFQSIVLTRFQQSTINTGSIVEGFKKGFYLYHNPWYLRLKSTYTQLLLTNALTRMTRPVLRPLRIPFPRYNLLLNWFYPESEIYHLLRSLQGRVHNWLHWANVYLHVYKDGLLDSMLHIMNIR